MDPKEIGKEYKAYYDVSHVLRKYMDLESASIFAAMIVGYTISPDRTKPAQMGEFRGAVEKCMALIATDEERHNESN
jgi:hypothetical protein